MADVRYKNDVVLVDPTTPTQQAAIDASGRLSVSLAASSATVTVDSELPAAAALADGAANPTSPIVGGANLTYNGTTWDRQRSVAAAQDTAGTGIAAAGLLAQLDDVSTATVTENQFAPVRLSSRRALLVEGVASGANLNVNLAASAVTVTVDTELPAAAALADATANPTVPGVGGFLMGYNGTTWDRVRTANTGRLQVDVVSGGSADTPTNPVVVTLTKTALAAGSATTTELRSTDLGGTTKKLTKIMCWASVAFKAQFNTQSNGTPTTVAVFGGQAFQEAVYEPPGGRTGRNYHSVTFSANAGFDGFEVIMTNLDTSEAADVYCNIYYED